MQESDHRDPSLTAALRALAEDEARVGASPMVEARLLEEVRSVAWARRRRACAIVFASAAALFLAVGVPVWRSTARRGLAAPVGTLAAVPRGEVATAFLPLVYASVPVSGAHIVRLEVSQRALASFGLAFPDPLDDSTSRTVLADVVVGEDGLARAVRFVRPVAHQKQKP